MFDVQSPYNNLYFGAGQDKKNLNTFVLHLSVSSYMDVKRDSLAFGIGPREKPISQT